MSTDPRARHDQSSSLASSTMSSEARSASSSACTASTTPSTSPETSVWAVTCRLSSTSCRRRSSSVDASLLCRVAADNSRLRLARAAVAWFMSCLCASASWASISWRLQLPIDTATLAHSDRLISTSSSPKLPWVPAAEASAAVLVGEDGTATAAASSSSLPLIRFMTCSTPTTRRPAACPDSFLESLTTERSLPHALRPYDAEKLAPGPCSGDDLD